MPDTPITYDEIREIRKNVLVEMNEERTVPFTVQDYILAETRVQTILQAGIRNDELVSNKQARDNAKKTNK